MLASLIEWWWRCGWWLSVLGPISTSIDMFTQKSAQSCSKYFYCFFFLWKMWHLNSFLLLWKLGKNLADRCPEAAQMSPEVRILSNNCQHFIKIWLFLPNPRAKWNSLSPACLSQWTHASQGGESKDNNNHEVGCDLIFNAKPRQHYYTNWKLCECVCLSSSSLSPCLMITWWEAPGFKFQC